ncbi:MAG: hypothetical protein ACE5GS_03855 [Kiloniellaceae bacterium]
MARPSKAAERSIATFLFALLAFSPPILSIFSAKVSLFGIPLLYLYLFTIWAVIIALVAWIADLGRTREPPAAPGDGREAEG